MVKVVWGERDAYNESGPSRSGMPTKYSRNPESLIPLLHHMLVSHLLKRGRRVPSLPSSFCTLPLLRGRSGKLEDKKRGHHDALFVLENLPLASSTCKVCLTPFLR